MKRRTSASGTPRHGLGYTRLLVPPSSQAAVQASVATRNLPGTSMYDSLQERSLEARKLVSMGEAIPTRIPHVAVIGFWDGLSSLYTLEMRCRWVAPLLEGAVKFANIKEM
ncbi:hypothetical protein Tco_0542058 [Tanacetum coccineum]